MEGEKYKVEKGHYNVVTLYDSLRGKFHIRKLEVELTAKFPDAETQEISAHRRMERFQVLLKQKVTKSTKYDVHQYFL